MQTRVVNTNDNVPMPGSGGARQFGAPIPEAISKPCLYIPSAPLLTPCGPICARPGLMVITSHWQPSSVFSLSVNGLACPLVSVDGSAFSSGPESLEDLCAAWLVDDGNATAPPAAQAAPAPMCPVTYCCGAALAPAATAQLQSPVAAALAAGGGAGAAAAGGGSPSPPGQAARLLFRARDVLNATDGSLASGWIEDGWLQLVTVSNGSAVRARHPSPAPPLTLGSLRPIASLS